jgi:hypothetical protein
LAAEILIKGFRTNGIPQDESPRKNAIWRNVPKDMICHFLRRFESHPLNISFQRDDLASFLENTDEPKLLQWDVVLPNGEGPSTNFVGVSYRPQKRKVDISRDTKSILVSGEKRRVGSRGIEKEGIPEEIIREIESDEKYRNKSVPDHAYRARRTKPLLLLHLIKPYFKGEEYDTGGNTLVAVGLSFPEFDDRDVTRRVRYRVNLVEWRNMIMAEMDDEIEEEED